MKENPAVPHQRFYLCYRKISVIANFLNCRFANLSDWKYWAIEVGKR